MIDLNDELYILASNLVTIISSSSTVLQPNILFGCNTVHSVLRIHRINLPQLWVQFALKGTGIFHGKHLFFVRSIFDGGSGHNCVQKVCNSYVRNVCMMPVTAINFAIDSTVCAFPSTRRTYRG